MRKFDYSSLSEAHWGNKVVSLLSRIHEFRGKQELLLKQKPAALERLLETARIQSIQGSNNIEGIRTSPFRLKQIVTERIAPHSRNEAEIAGYRDALNVIDESFEDIPLKSSYILQLHRMMLSQTDSPFAGRFKTGQNLIVGEGESGVQRARFTPLSPVETPIAIQQICDSFNSEIDRGEVDPLILIPSFVLDFLCIHPFDDGNGRMSRLLTDLLLYRSGYLIGKYVSLEHRIDRTKEAYYAALEDSDQSWNTGENDSTPFIEYILGVILFCYRELDSRMGSNEESIPSLELVRRAVSKRIGRFTKEDIQIAVPQLGNTSIVKALNQLIEEGLIERRGAGRGIYYVRKD